MSEEDRRPRLGNPKTFEDLSARVAVLEALAFGANVYIVKSYLENGDLPQARQHIEGLAQLAGYAMQPLEEGARNAAKDFANDILRTLESFVVDAEVTTQKPN